MNSSTKKSLVVYFNANDIEVSSGVTPTAAEAVAVFRTLADHKLNDGSHAITRVNVFAVNWVCAESPYFGRENGESFVKGGNPLASQMINANTLACLDLVPEMKRLMPKTEFFFSILGNGSYPDRTSPRGGFGYFDALTPDLLKQADDFAAFVKTHFIDAYQLDGLDIDYEYFNGKDASGYGPGTPMVVTKLKSKDMLLSNALYGTINYDEKWVGTTFLAIMSYLYQMDYGGAPYPTPGNVHGSDYNDRVWWGYNTNSGSVDSMRNALYLLNEYKYAGFMLYDYGGAAQKTTLENIVAAMNAGPAKGVGG
jgi:hypothetical protein